MTGNTSTGLSPTGGSPTFAAASTTLAQATTSVLVVDDSAVDRVMAGRLLEKAGGFSVRYATNGREALELADAEPPDLILTDLQMPELDGLGLVQEVRQRHPLVPTILMTAHGSEEVALKALQRGAASYVPKRNLGQDLAATVRDVSAIARAGRQQRRLRQYWTRAELRFRLENDAALVPVAVAYFQQQLRSLCDCDETELIRIGVALHEALTNAMHHGNLELDSTLREEGYDRYFQLAEQRRFEDPFQSRRVEVVVEESPLEGRYVIRDEGPGFNHSVESFDPTSLEALDRPSGRGLFLIRTFMHEVFHNDRGNEITMIHRRLARAQSAAPAAEP